MITESFSLSNLPITFSSLWAGIRMETVGSNLKFELVLEALLFFDSP